MNPNNNNKPTVKRYGTELGRSGTFKPSGIITLEEYNNNLVGQNGRKLYDIMRRSDGTVHSALQACKLPILSVDYDIDPASDDPQDEYIARYIEDQLFNQNLNFTDFIREGMTMFDFGFSVFEKTYELTEFENKPVIGVQSIHSRKQRTILFWEQADHSPGVQQQLLNSTDGKQGIISIPRDKLIIFTNNKEGENDEGISLLRFAYKDWDMKDKLGLVNGIALEKMAVGVPVLLAPPDADEGEKKKARAALRAFRANEEAFIELPTDWAVEMMDMKANSAKDVLPTIMYHDKQILLSVLAQFLELGSSKSGGSRALSQDHSQLFMLSEEAAVKNIVATIQDELIKQLCDLNFSDLPNGYPQLRAGRVSDESIATTAAAVNQFMSVGALTADPELESWVRDTLHAPELPEQLQDPDAYNEAKMKTPPTTKDDPSLGKDQPDKQTALDEAKAARKRLISELVNN